VKQNLSPPEIGHDVVAVEHCADPVAALLAAHRAGGLISLPTSGTTGRPRRVIRTAASWVDSFPLVAELITLEPRNLAWIPGPLTASMNLYAAALVAHCEGQPVEDVRRATHAFLTPAALRELLDDEAPRGLRIVVAGDRLSPELADRAEERGWRVSHYYGATQLSFVAWGRDAASLRPFLRVEVQVRDGELWASSPWLCDAEVVTGGGPSMAVELDPLSGCRWASVGDRGEVTADGRVVVAGRTDAILVGGATVLISEVEATLRDAAKGEVYVVGAAHDRLGSIVTAVCTDPTDLDGLRSHARTVLERDQRPVRWVHMPKLPLTAAGKVDRTALAALAVRD
jgi:long-chain acyl-CoA synthetase